MIASAGYLAGQVAGTMALVAIAGFAIRDHLRNRRPRGD